MEGILGDVGKFFGVVDMYESATGFDTLTGAQLTPEEQFQRGVIGASSFFLTAVVPAMQAMSLDVCLFNGCFIAGTQVVLDIVDEEDPATAQATPHLNLTADVGTLTATRR
jgi:hypothetical protein